MADFPALFLVGLRQIRRKQITDFVAGRTVILTKGWDAQLNFVSYTTPRKVHEITNITYLYLRAGMELKMICFCSQGGIYYVYGGELLSGNELGICRIFSPMLSSLLVPKNIFFGTANGEVGDILSQPSIQ